MKNVLFFLALILPCGIYAQSLPLRTWTDSLSYALGRDAGEQFKSAPVEIDVKAMSAGLTDALNDEPGGMTVEQARLFLSDFFNRRLPEIQKQKGLAYLEEIECSHPKVQKTERGLLYEILEPGIKTNLEPPLKVSVHYVGKLSNGMQFDSSYEREEPLVIQIDRVIEGWTEGLNLIGEGRKIRLWIPYYLAYGEYGSGPIPPYEPLFFEVELLEVVQE